MKIECLTNQCTDFEDNYDKYNPEGEQNGGVFSSWDYDPSGTDFEYIHGHWNDDTVEIDLVYMGSAKRSGHCTRAVGYMLKVLLKEAEKVQEYPYKGKVRIYSETPCAAVNCYVHAFMINGFTPNDKEIENFNRVSKLSKEGEFVNFTFENFISESQEIKRNDVNNVKKRHLHLRF